MKHAIWVAIIVALASPALAQDKKDKPKDAPKVIMALPLGVPAGKPTKVTLRGLLLDGATEVRWADPKLTTPLKILNKGKAGVPDKMEAARVGDTQVEVEVTLTPETVTTPALIVKTPAGDTPPHTLLVETDVPVIAKKEPNGGFRQAQALNPPQVVEGTISGGQDVDVFRVEGKAGLKLTAEVLASRFGSALDPLLTLHDATGRQLAFSDDDDGGDARLAVVLPRDGAYFLTLVDANDTASAMHAYRLVVQIK